MDSDLLLLAVVVAAIAASVATLAVVARDGYRRVPTDASRVPQPAEPTPARRDDMRPANRTAADVSERGARGRDGMPRAVATPIPPR
jgi:hypothetical protein